MVHCIQGHPFLDCEVQLKDTSTIRHLTGDISTSKGTDFQGEMKKRGVLLHGVPYRIPKWSTPKNHVVVE